MQLQDVHNVCGNPIFLPLYSVSLKQGLDGFV